jgi:Uma2 family endonuclease
MNLPVSEMPTPFRFMPETAMTDDELLCLCERNEILWIERDAKGWIHVRPIAGWRVSSAEVAICSKLGRWTDRDGRGKAFLCAGFVLPDSSMFGCSLAWMLNDRWRSLTRDQQKGFAPLCPDFVIEVLSPFDKLENLEAKMKLWIANGAQLAWMIDLDREVVVVSVRS